jgi:hypothetical protein
MSMSHNLGYLIKRRRRKLVIAAGSEVNHEFTLPSPRACDIELPRGPEKRSIDAAVSI